MSLEKLIQESDIDKHYSVLDNIGNLPQGGFSRIAWTDEETDAMQYFKRISEELGLETKYDAVGNLYITMPGEWDSHVMLGSHLDTVTRGGNYDGAAGIVAGFEAIKNLWKEYQERNISLKKGLQLVIWRGEESTIGAAYKGSKAAFGLPFTKDVLASVYDGSTLEEMITQQQDYLKSLGEEVTFDPSHFRTNKSSLSDKEISSIDSYMEYHIEQGPILEQNELDVGFATSIRGPHRFVIELEEKDDKKMARMIVNADRIVQRDAEKMDIVMTHGVINKPDQKSASPLDEMSMNKVFGYSEIKTDFNYISRRDEIGNIAQKLGVQVRYENADGMNKIVLIGDDGHSGTMPRGTRYRKDANLAAAYIIDFIAKESPDSKVFWNDSENSTYSVDIRSNDERPRDDLVKRIKRSFTMTAHNNDFEYRLTEEQKDSPVEEMNKELIKTATDAAKQLGYESIAMPCGAGHDAVIPYKVGIPSLLVLGPCVDGKSHNHLENQHHIDTAKGANQLMYSAYLRAAY